MAKDPAFLFYYDRFLSGTFTMTDSQVGQYIRLLCLQANKGYVTKKDMNNICKTYDEDIAEKFTEIELDKYANPTLVDIMNQRKVFTESRRNNRKGKKYDKSEEVNNICKSHDEHMVNVNLNKDIDVIKDVVVKEKAQRKKFVIPSVEDVQAFANENMIGSKDLPERFVNYYEANGWMINRNHMKNWQATFKNWVLNEKKYETNQRTNGKQFASETPAERKERQYRDFGKSINGGNELPDFFALTNFD